MTRDKMKPAYLHPGYWGRALKTHVRPAPQDGQVPHDFGCAQGVSRTKRGTVRRATDRPKGLSIWRGLISTYSWFSTRPPQNATSILNPTAKYLGGGYSRAGMRGVP